MCAHAAGSAHLLAERSFSLDQSPRASPSLAADTSDFYCGFRLQSSRLPPTRLSFCNLQFRQVLCRCAEVEAGAACVLAALKAMLAAGASVVAGEAGRICAAVQQLVWLLAGLWSAQHSPLDRHCLARCACAAALILRAEVAVHGFASELPKWNAKVALSVLSSQNCCRRRCRRPRKAHLSANRL